jgi:hypothetical protein
MGQNFKNEKSAQYRSAAVDSTPNNPSKKISLLRFVLIFFLLKNKDIFW